MSVLLNFLKLIPAYCAYATHRMTSELERELSSTFMNFASIIDPFRNLSTREGSGFVQVESSSSSNLLALLLGALGMKASRSWTGRGGT